MRGCLFALLFSLACQHERPCEPGSAVECRCPGKETGTQTCDAHGTFGACACPSALPRLGGIEIHLNEDYVRVCSAVALHECAVQTVDSSERVSTATVRLVRATRDCATQAQTLYRECTAARGAGANGGLSDDEWAACTAERGMVKRDHMAPAAPAVMTGLTINLRCAEGFASAHIRPRPSG